LVNSLIKAGVYTEVGVEGGENFSGPGGLGALDANLDFRKRLHIHTHLRNILGPDSSSRWGCRCRHKCYQGTRIVWVSLAGFDVNEFKSMVKLRRRGNIIQRYYPSLTSRVKSFFRGKPRERFESALYRMGHGEKSIFWYWEIDYGLQHYREFRTIDLAEGARLFREEDFDSWPEWA